jgi:hypothetical protein
MNAEIFMLRFLNSVMASGVETSLNISDETRLQSGNSQRFLDFARNDKDGAWRSIVECRCHRFHPLFFDAHLLLDRSPFQLGKIDITQRAPIRDGESAPK